MLMITSDDYYLKYVRMYIYVEDIISVKYDTYVHVMYIHSECIGSLLITTYVLNRTLYLRGGLTYVGT